MTVARLPAAMHQLQPWKNGLGVSRIIASEPPGAGYDAVLWQVGSTEITADCPFSSLPGLDRLFMVIEGAGVELTSVDDVGKTRMARIEPMQPPYALRGDWKTDCRLLDGAVRAFNVATRRGKAKATVEYLDAKMLTKAAGETVIAVHLGSLDAWLLQGPGKESAAISPPPGPVALIRIAS